VQLFRQRARPVAVLRQEHFNDGVGRVHSSSGVDAGRDAKGDLRCRGNARRKSGEIEKSSQSGILHGPQPFQAMFHDHPILARKRNNVRYRSDGDQLQKGFGQPEDLVFGPL
jgi:hypothetical protein